jgi:shikimate kinase
LPTSDLPELNGEWTVKIYLCGMIGSGKTTLGIRLAKALGLPFYDLDREMDKILGYSFHRLVQEQGWVAFRELEYSLCKRFAGMRAGVFALGGGTVRYEWNTDVLRGTGVTILLEAPLDVLVERVKRADRPRVHAGTTLEQDVQNIWGKHKGLYHAAADLVFPTDEGEIDTMAARLTDLIMEHFRTSPESGSGACP